jgi:hypothetical protein
MVKLVMLIAYYCAWTYDILKDHIFVRFELHIDLVKFKHVAAYIIYDIIKVQPWWKYFHHDCNFVVSS